MIWKLYREIIFITYFIDLMANNVYFIIGTYLIQDGKSPMPVNKETNNSVIEIFSGDVIKFGQGMAFIFHIHDMIFGKNQTILSYKYSIF